VRLERVADAMNIDELIVRGSFALCIGWMALVVLLSLDGDR
jgi:hypothetical protein